MGRKFNVWVFVAVVVFLPIAVFGVVQFAERRYQPLPFLGPAGHTIAPFTFTNQAGKQVGTGNWKDKIVVANFFFTHCPSICPKMTYNLKRLQAYSGVANVSINSFTVDPERDSVSKLAGFAEKFDISGDWNLLTGNKKELYKMARKSFMITATDGDGGPEDFIHSENLVLIDKQGRIRGYYRGTDEPSINRLIKDIQKLARED